MCACGIINLIYDKPVDTLLQVRIIIIEHHAIEVFVVEVKLAEEITKVAWVPPLGTTVRREGIEGRHHDVWSHGRNLGVGARGAHIAR